MQHLVNNQRQPQPGMAWGQQDQAHRPGGQPAAAPGRAQVHIAAQPQPAAAAAPPAPNNRPMTRQQANRPAQAANRPVAGGANNNLAAPPAQAPPQQPPAAEPRTVGDLLDAVLVNHANEMAEHHRRHRNRYAGGGLGQGPFASGSGNNHKKGK